ncbi:MAG: 5'/3'-nucleotidase SurE [Proteobacteria bacterium]|nr:5'/3'-nucleotidase SurE [Pseudomonadota bacterium]MDA1332261.1 5'/3'-nucleotidase SurE [Pseudomonadota bacterium]
MKILISNDDGVFAPGLQALIQVMMEIGEVVVVAPNKDYSGASNSLTLDRPLVLHQHESNIYSVNGTPADCVHLAITGLLDVIPDIVVSGINNGANLAEDTIYSGTVAAAMEGFMLGLPAIAVSLASKNGEHFPTAAKVARDIVLSCLDIVKQSPFLLNVNVPDIKSDSITGMRITRLGRRHKAEGVVQTKNPRGQTVYWIGAAGSAKDRSSGTDFDAVEGGFVSITPLQVDLTDVSVGARFDFLSR